MCIQIRGLPACHSLVALAISSFCKAQGLQALDLYRCTLGMLQKLCAQRLQEVRVALLSWLSALLSAVWTLSIGGNPGCRISIVWTPAAHISIPYCGRKMGSCKAGWTVDLLSRTQSFKLSGSSLSVSQPLSQFLASCSSGWMRVGATPWFWAAVNL